jgi:uncharacterized protein
LLSIILYLLLGWQFMAEWLGGILLVVIMSVLVKLTYPKQLAEEARRHKEEGEGHQHMATEIKGANWRKKLANPESRIAIAQNFTMEWMMLWKDLAAGFLIGGFLAVFVPHDVWRALFVTDESPWLKIPLNALLGPVVAMLTFVCSIGNEPLAAVLFAGGAGFGGVIAFLYADLIVIPLLDPYRRYFGWRMAAYIAVVFYLTMVLAAIVMDLIFTGAGWLPPADQHAQQQLHQFSLNYTFWLNLGFGLLAIYWF